MTGEDKRPATWRELSYVENFEDKIDQELLKKYVKFVLADFKVQQRLVVKLYFGLEDDEPRTGKEVGEILGVSAVRVYQILNWTLRRLQHPIYVRRLLPFVRSYPYEPQAPLPELFNSFLSRVCVQPGHKEKYEKYLNQLIKEKS